MALVPYDEAAARQDPAVRLRPAFVAAAADVMPGLTERFPGWRDIPHILNHDEAFARRMASAEAGQKARVDFKRSFARFVEARFPGFDAGSTSNDVFRYTKTIDGKLAIALTWLHKSAHGVGKLLELKIGARWDDKAGVVDWLIPWFYGFAEIGEWAYRTKDDLEACLAGGAAFLDALLPAFTRSLATRMAMPELPGGAGAATAHAAVAIANQVVDRLRVSGTMPEGGLVLAGAEIRQTTGRWGPHIAADGRIRAHQQWIFRFLANDGRSLTVEVPHIGAPVTLWFGKAISRVEPIEGTWIDGGAALQAVASDSRFPQDAAFTALVLGYQRPYVPGACWRVDFVIPGKAIRGLAWVEAASGKAVFF